jgi:hypothetical protein
VKVAVLFKTLGSIWIQSSNPEGGNAASPIADIDFGMIVRVVATLAAASVSQRKVCQCEQPRAVGSPIINTGKNSQIYRD